jgi:hypothetical protein
MQLNYTQGLIRGQQDPTSHAKLFLQKQGTNIGIYVTDQPLQAVVAHRAKHYLISEPVNVGTAWTVPLGESWIYWDINLVTGLPTRGVTQVQPAFGTVDPAPYYASLTAIPVNDQHYFNKTTMRHYRYVQSSTSWVEVIRVFAAHIANNGVLTAMPFSSQVGLTGNFTAGYIIYTLASKPFIDPDTLTFVNTGSGYLLKTGANNGLQVDLSYEPFFAVAGAPLPEFTVVAPTEDGTFIAADGPSGRQGVALCMFDTATGAVFRPQASGIARGNFIFDIEDLGKTVWLGPNGVLLTERPFGYASQAIGIIMGTDALLVTIAQRGADGIDGSGSGEARIYYGDTDPFPIGFEGVFQVATGLEQLVCVVFPGLGQGSLQTGTFDHRSNDLGALYEAFLPLGEGNVELSYQLDEEQLPISFRFKLINQLAGIAFGDALPFIAFQDGENVGESASLSYEGDGIPGRTALEGDVYIMPTDFSTQPPTPARLFVAGADGQHDWCEYATKNDIFNVEERVDYLQEQVNSLQEQLGASGDGTHALIFEIADSSDDPIYAIHMPYGFRVTNVRASVTAPSPEAVTIDVMMNGVSIFTTPISIDNGATSSNGIPFEFADNNGSFALLPDDSLITITQSSPVSQVGMRVMLIGTLHTSD